MLITDSDILTEGWLAAVDPEVSALSQKDPASLPAIEGPNSIIRQTAQHACHYLVEQFQAFTGFLSAPGSRDAASSFVANAYNTALNRSRFSIHQVVALEPEPTRSLVSYWMQYDALYRFFRAIALRKLDDRFEKKRDEYEKERKRAWERLTKSGLPIQVAPLAAPAAVREYQCGVWGQGNVTAGGSGSHDPGAAYDVSVTYVGAAYASWKAQNQAESGPSPTVTLSTAAGQLITVSIATLSPPNGINQNLGVPDVLYSPMAATGWNVYVGPAGGVQVLQNAAPIPVATLSYTLADVPSFASGNSVGPGQPPSNYFAYQRTMDRA